MKEVYVAYAKEDKKEARKLVSRLESAEISCWVSPRDFENNNESAVNEAIKNSRIFVVVLSETAQFSVEVIKAVEYSLEYGLPIIPVKVSKTKPAVGMSYFLHNLDWVDVHEDGFEEAFGVLLEIIAEINEGKVSEPRFVRKKDIQPDEGMSKKKILLLSGAVLVALIVIYFGFFNNKNSEKPNDNIMSQENLVSEENPLVGAWRIVDYEDDRKMAPQERAAMVQNIEALKRAALVVFGKDGSFQRSGFAANTENGTWEFDEKNKKVYLTPIGSKRKEELNIFKLEQNLLTIVVVENVQNDDGSFTAVTTKITFQKQVNS